jgi:hypothetical protein
MGTLSLVGDVAAEPTEKSSLRETMDKHAGYLFQYETGLVESETRSGMSQATQLDSLSVGYTIRLYAAMIGYGYECMRTPL